MFKKLLAWFFLGSTTSSSTLHNEAEVGDDDVFTVSTCHPKSSFMVRLRKGFSFYASGLALSHHGVWTLGCVLFDGSISSPEFEASCWPPVTTWKACQSRWCQGLKVKKWSPLDFFCLRLRWCTCLPTLLSVLEKLPANSGTYSRKKGFKSQLYASKH